MSARTSTSNRTTIAAILMVCAFTFWGLNAVASKLLYRVNGAHLDAIGLFVARSAWTLPLFIVLAIAFRPRPFVIRPRDWLLFGVLALAYGPATVGVFAIGTANTSAAHAVLLFSLAPPIASLLGAFFYRETVSPIRIVALGIGIAGAAVLTLGRATHGSSPFGDAMVLIMVLSFSIMGVIVRGFRGRYSPYFLAGTYGTGGTLMLVGAGLALGHGWAITAPLHFALGDALWFYSVIVIGLSVIAQVGQNIALRTFGVGTFSIVTAYGSLLVGIIASLLVLAEGITPTMIAAGVLLAIALGLSLAPMPSARALPQIDGNNA